MIGTTTTTAISMHPLHLHRIPIDRLEALSLPLSLSFILSSLELLADAPPAPKNSGNSPWKPAARTPSSSSSAPSSPPTSASTPSPNGPPGLRSSSTPRTYPSTSPARRSSTPCSSASSSRSSSSILSGCSPSGPISRTMIMRSSGSSMIRMARS